MKIEVAIEWDDESLEHIAKHNVRYTEVNKAVSGRVVMRKVTRRGEELREVIGQAEGRLLYIILKPYGDRYRVKTARDATRSEKRLYKKRGK